MDQKVWTFCTSVILSGMLGMTDGVTSGRIAVAASGPSNLGANIDEALSGRLIGYLGDGANTPSITNVSNVRASDGVLKETDAELVRNLNRLTRRKRRQDTKMAVTCSRLGLSSECTVFQAAYKEDDGIIHSFNTFTEAGSGVLRLIVYRRNDPPAGDFFLIDIGAGIQRAMALRRDTGQPVWSPLPNGPARDSLNAEFAYWRNQQNELAKEPDVQGPAISQN
ncbi:MAG: hypothetical protein HY078_12385 [Elusimicrobia bacterium]|nr:hypothetical protein [Elusimicrobiota bacterium]